MVDIYATHGGAPAIERFSRAHDITTAEAWTAALILMSLAEVLGRTTVLSLRVLATGGRRPGPSRLFGV